MAIPRSIQEILDIHEEGRATARALDRLLTNDAYLLRVDANERSIVFRFALYLQEELPDLHVDCEFNRDGVDPKRISGIWIDPEAADTDGKTVFPDVIVHRRGERAQNRLVIEFKKSTNQTSREVDYKKLRAYKDGNGLRYQHALFIEVSISSDPSISVAEWV